MLNPRLVALIKSEVDEICRPKTESLLSGGPQTYEAYRESVGYLQAMRDFLDIVDKIDSQDNQ